MVKHLTAHGNSSALIIEKPVMELLNINNETPLEITTDGKNLIISPIRNVKREDRFKKALNKVNQRHSKTLKTLAE